MGRSNARAGPSQSQRPSQTQRIRAGRAQVEEVPEEEEDEEINDDDGDDNDEIGGAGEAMDVDDDADSVRMKREIRTRKIHIGNVRNSLAELTHSFVWHFSLSTNGPFCDETR